MTWKERKCVFFVVCESVTERKCVCVCVCVCVCDRNRVTEGESMMCLKQGESDRERESV